MSDDATPKTTRHLAASASTFIPAAGGMASRPQPSCGSRVREVVEPASSSLVPVRWLDCGDSNAPRQPPAGCHWRARGRRATHDHERCRELSRLPGRYPGSRADGLFRKQAERFGARVVDVDVERIDLGSRPFRLWAAGVEYRAEAVIVATVRRRSGSGSTVKLVCAVGRQRLRHVRWFFYRDKEVGVVGGGDSAFEEALFLTRFASRVHLIHRRDQFRCSKILQARAVAHPKIELHLNRTVEEVLGADKVEALRSQDQRARRRAPEGRRAVRGHRPSAQRRVFRDWLETDAKGYLRTEGATTPPTSRVFIAGTWTTIAIAGRDGAGEGCRAAIDAERWLESQESAARSSAVAAPEQTQPATV